MRDTFLFLFFTPFYLFGQYQLKGKVIDGLTREPLPFVNIISVNQKQGTTTDIDGLFTISSTQPIGVLKLSYVGYELTEFDASNQKNIEIGLKRTSYNIAEFVVMPGINPAERIINEVVKNRKKHNPEKSIDFKYDSYNKTYFTLAFNPKRIVKADSTTQKTNDWLETHHLFMMESVTQRKYKLPDKSYEKVIGTKVSGLSNPSFSLIGTELQSLSFYNPQLIVMDKFYLNPISENSINKYLFLIEDTTFVGSDTTFIISFRPRKGKNFDALKGLLYVNTDGFALQNVIAEPVIKEKGFSIKIQQQYKKIDGSWFPVQLNSTLILRNKQLRGVKTLVVSRSYLKNIEINPEIDKKEFSYIDTEMSEDAGKKEDEFWGVYREGKLSQREKNTYHVVDSIGKVEHLDRKMKFLEALVTGQIKVGFVNLDLNRFIAYNDYEGTRLGGGLHTNKQILKWASVGGYGAYGFKDKEFKYGGDLHFNISERSDIGLNFSVLKDIEEPGVVNYYDYKVPMLSDAGYRTFYLSRMNRTDKMEARFEFRTLRYLKVYTFANQEKVEVTNDYYFKQQIDENTIVNDQDYTFSNLGVELRYAFKEKVIKTLGTTFAKATTYPIIYAKIEQGTTLLDGEFEYTRYAVKAEKKFYIKNMGRSGFSVETGLIEGNVPQHKLNSSIGTNKSFDLSWTKRLLNVSSENVFETMQPYEFFSSKYVHFHFRHSFGSLLFSIKKFKPEVVLTSSAGFGSLSNVKAHGGVAFKTMEKGYYESGILLRNLLQINTTTAGVGFFYRYGPYSLPVQNQNFTIKASVGFAF
ncbi:MAG: DUF5686 family protein [Polaribacter sp.]